MDAERIFPPNHNTEYAIEHNTCYAEKSMVCFHVKQNTNDLQAQGMEEELENRLSVWMQRRLMIAEIVLLVYFQPTLGQVP